MITLTQINNLLISQRTGTRFKFYFKMFCIFFLLSALSCFGSTVWPRPQGSVMSARELFAMLPPSIFENTEEGLSEKEFYQLVDEGRSEDWRISSESVDDMTVSSNTPWDSIVFLHICRSENGDLIVLLGTKTRMVCALELWHCDKFGGITPLPALDDPAIEDFYLPGRVPASSSPSITMCLEGDKVVAKALIWDKYGNMLDAPQDFMVSYVWNGSTFVKNVVPAPR